MSETYAFALSLYENGQWNECCDLLEETLESRPPRTPHEERDDLILLLALLYLQKGQTKALTTLINHSKVLQERRELIYLMMGDIVRGNVQIAITEDVPTLYTLGLFWERRNNTEEALKAYEKCLKKDPSFLPAINNLALLYEKMGKVFEAKNLYERGTSLDKDNPYLQVNLAILLSRVGSFRRNWTITDSLTELTPPLLAVLVSFFFVRDKRYNLAIKVLDKQLSKTEKLPSLWYAHGLTLEARGYFEQAFSSYQKGWQLDFTNKTILKSLLQLLFKNERWAEMAEILNLVKEDAPHREDVRFFAAVLEMKNQQWEKAELNLRYVLNHTQPKNLYKMAKQSSMIAGFDPIINPDLSESFWEPSLHLLAVLYDQTKNYAQSALLLEQLREEVPSNELYILSSALQLAKDGKLDTAWERVEEGLTQNPNHLMGNLLKAKLLMEKGDREGASNIVERLDQSNEAVQLMNREMLTGVTFQSNKPFSNLWALPWPILENSLKKYFIPSPDRSYRFFWTIGDKTFFIPAGMGETLSNQEMLAFYQETPFNAIESVTHLQEPLEEGELLESSNVTPHEAHDLSPDITSVLSSVETDTASSEPAEPSLTSVTQPARTYTLEDLAILIDSVENSPLLSDDLHARIEKTKDVFMPSESFKDLESLKDFWRKAVLSSEEQ